MSARITRSIIATLAACAIAGCGGTPALNHAPPAIQTPGTPAKTASSTLSIAIPLPKGGASASRAPRFVSSGTASGGIVVGYNVGPQFISQSFDLSSTSPNCSTATGVRTCTVTVDLPLGNDTIALYTYDGPLAGGKPSGHMLAVATVTTGIIEGKHNSVAMSLLGVPANVTIAPDRSSIQSLGQAVTVPLTTTVYDAAGNQIVGADPYSEPIAIEATGAGFGLNVVINGNPNNGGYMTRPGDTAAITYAGRGGSGDYTIRARINYGNTQIGSAPFTITPGMRLAQQIFTNLAHADLTQRYDNRDVWITEPAAHALATYTSSGTFTQYAIASGKEPRHIVFTGINGVFPGAGTPFIISEVPDVIGTVHADSTVTDHQTPTPNSGIGQILFDYAHFTTTFAETTAGKIAKSDLGGNMTEYPIGIAGATPVGLAFNYTSGGTWFTDPGNNAIGLMQPDHTVTEYPIPTAGAGPNAIVGVDTNNTWFTEDNAPKLGHIDNSTHAIVEYPSPDVITALVPGASDGFTSLWAVLRNGTVERFDAGTSTFTPITGTLPANGLTVVAATIGVQNNVWILRSGVSVSELDELIY
jgi:streptogramin lyase